jgi:hypothetical protein
VPAVVTTEEGSAKQVGFFLGWWCLYLCVCEPPVASLPDCIYKQCMSSHLWWSFRLYRTRCLGVTPHSELPLPCCCFMFCLPHPCTPDPPPPGRGSAGAARGPPVHLPGALGGC